MTSKNCYVYFIAWSKLNLWYYGRRTAKNCDPSELFISYFTSSEYVKEIRELYGDPDVIQIRRQFGEDHDACIKWESDVLRRMKVSSREDCLNKIASASHTTTGLFPGYTKNGEFIGMVSVNDPRKGTTIFSFMQIDESLKNKLRIAAARRQAAGKGWKNSDGVQISEMTVKNGTHSGLAKNRNPKCDEAQRELVRSGNHHWLSEDHKRKTSENSKKRIAEKSHAFTKRIKCECCGKETTKASYGRFHKKCIQELASHIS